jgi:hypothetical protein
MQFKDLLPGDQFTFGTFGSDILLRIDLCQSYVDYSLDRDFFETACNAVRLKDGHLFRFNPEHIITRNSN